MPHANTQFALPALHSAVVILEKKSSKNKLSEINAEINVFGQFSLQ